MKIVLLGKEAQVVWELQRSLSTIGDPVASEQHELDLECLDDVRWRVYRYEPDIIANAAAYTAVDQSESEPDEVYPIKTEAYPLPAKRPHNSRLSGLKLTNIFGVHLPDWHIHVKRLIDELAPQGGL